MEYTRWLRDWFNSKDWRCIIRWKDPEWSDDLLYLWDLINWKANGFWHAYMQWLKAYEWDFYNWKYDWYGKIYNDWILYYEWELKEWVFEWYWTKYYDIWKVLYKWEFIEFHFSLLIPFLIIT